VAALKIGDERLAGDPPKWVYRWNTACCGRAAGLGDHPDGVAIYALAARTGAELDAFRRHVMRPRVRVRDTEDGGLWTVGEGEDGCPRDGPPSP
jgi:hypothetical protein